MNSNETSLAAAATFVGFRLPAAARRTVGKPALDLPPRVISNGLIAWVFIGWIRDLFWALKGKSMRPHSLSLFLFSVVAFLFFLSVFAFLLDSRWEWYPETMMAISLFSALR